MEKLKEELEALKIQLIQQGEELEKLSSHPSSTVQDGTSTHSAVIPSFPRGPMETVRPHSKRALSQVFFEGLVLR